MHSTLWNYQVEFAEFECFYGVLTLHVTYNVLRHVMQLSDERVAGYLLKIIHK